MLKRVSKAVSRKKKYPKSLIYGVAAGSVAGAITLYILATRSGRQIASDFYERSRDWYDENSVNEGREKAQKIIESARRQAEQILRSAENILREAKEKREA